MRGRGSAGQDQLEQCLAGTLGQRGDARGEGGEDFAVGGKVDHVDDGFAAVEDREV